MNKDFVRQAKDPFGNNEKNANWWNVLHVDPPLMISVCLLCCFGLFVLFSASGSDIDIVRRQAFTMFLGLVVIRSVKTKSGLPLQQGLSCRGVA